jgi:serine/threonine protein kinase
LSFSRAKTIKEVDESKGRFSVILESTEVEYNLGSMFYKNTLGRIHNAMHIKTGKLITIKIYDYGDISEEDFLDRFKFIKNHVFKLRVRNMRKSFGYSSVDNDVRVSRMVQSIGCLEFADAGVSQDIKPENIIKYLYVDKNIKKREIMVAEEYVPGGSIKNILHHYYQFKERLVKNYTFQILLGLRDIHYNDIVHGDLKLSNLYIDDLGTLKLSDFGFIKQSFMLTSKYTDYNSLLVQTEGLNGYDFQTTMLPKFNSLLYTPPEVIRDRDYELSESYDVW